MLFIQRFALNTHPRVTFAKDATERGVEVNFFVSIAAVLASKGEGNKMTRSKHYEEVKGFVENAIDAVESEFDGVYKGYSDENAVSMYINDKHSINITCDNEAERAFKDVWQERSSHKK